MVQLTRPVPVPIPNNQPRYSITDWQIQMAKWEIHKRAGNLYDAAWWRWMPGVTISVKWPVGWVVLNEMSDGSTTSTQSADPNDHYRPWLEENVGKQGWDWQWQWGLRDNNIAENRLTIKIRNNRAKWATLATLLWG